MKKKKVKRKEARVGTPVEELNEKETLMHYNAVLIEDLRSDMKLVLERVEALDAKFDKKISDLEAKMEERTKLFEKSFQYLSKRMSTKDDSIEMERRICSKIDRITDRCENHEYRLSALEASH